MKTYFYVSVDFCSRVEFKQILIVTNLGFNSECVLSLRVFLLFCLLG
jgi:hypothetical protein